MGASVQPEPDQSESQNNSEGQENISQEQTGNQEQTSQQTQSTESRADRLLGLYEQQMRESHRRASELEAEIRRRDEAAVQQERNAPPVVPDVNATEFWNKPLPHIAQIVREETRKAVEPLYQFKTQIENQNKYDVVKTRFKNDPRYKDIFPKIEGIVDQLMQGSGSEPNDAMMNATILSAIGALHTGQIPGVTLDSPTQNQPQNQNQQQQQQNGPTNQGSQQVITPPHLRPSPMTQQQNTNKPKVRELTALEDRIARENNLTPAEYISWLEEDPTKIAVSKIGKAPPADPNANVNSQVVRGTHNPAGGR